MGDRAIHGKEEEDLIVVHEKDGSHATSHGRRKRSSPPYMRKRISRRFPLGISRRRPREEGERKRSSPLSVGKRTAKRKRSSSSWGRGRRRARRGDGRGRGAAARRGSSPVMGMEEELQYTGGAHRRAGTPPWSPLKAPPPCRPW
ncbi:unnamed protein product [Urochloa humidicola]